MGQRLIDTIIGLSTRDTLENAALHGIATIARITEKDSGLVKCYNDLIKEYRDVFTPTGTTLQIPDLFVHHRILTTGPPVHERSRRFSGERLDAAKKVFAKLLEQKVIRPSSSQWASPLYMVQKQNGGWRVTGDYRRLNVCTLPDRYPIVEDLFQESRGNIFSTLDLQRAFYQMPIADGDIEKTAVTTTFGLFEFLGTAKRHPVSAAHT